MTLQTEPCPCGRTASAKGKSRVAAVVRYAQCCGQYIEHLGTHPAPDAQSLMRSRYTAFVQGRADYLQATWHTSTRPAALDLDASVKWLGLTVRSHHATGDDAAVVEFIARYRVGSRAVRLHEISRFVRERGHWFYVDGDIQE